VPVSAVSPSILVSQIEIEKRERSQSRPPILPPPIALKGSGFRVQGSGSADDAK
jgi:hypothetical protein